MTPLEEELATALREMREACCAAMRVIAEMDYMKAIGAESDTYQQRFVEECHLAGICDGFGKRTDALLAQLSPQTDRTR